MNKFLVIAGLFLVCSLMNLVNVFLTGNGFSMVLGLAWLGASAFIFLRWRKMKKDSAEEETE